MVLESQPKLINSSHWQNQLIAEEAENINKIGINKTGPYVVNYLSQHLVNIY